MQTIDDILTKTKNRINRVEAPDHILTRAKQQLENLKEVATPKFMWSTAFATVILLLFNVYVVGQHKKITSAEYSTEPQIEELMFTSSNQLYTDE